MPPMPPMPPTARPSSCCPAPAPLAAAAANSWASSAVGVGRRAGSGCNSWQHMGRSAGGSRASSGSAAATRASEKRVPPAAVAVALGSSAAVKPLPADGGKNAPSSLLLLLLLLLLLSLLSLLSLL